VAPGTAETPEDITMPRFLEIVGEFFENLSSFFLTFSATDKLHYYIV